MHTHEKRKKKQTRMLYTVYNYTIRNCIILYKESVYLERIICKQFFLYVSNDNTFRCRSENLSTEFLEHYSSRLMFTNFSCSSRISMTQRLNDVKFFVTLFCHIHDAWD